MKPIRQLLVLLLALLLFILVACGGQDGEGTPTETVPETEPKPSLPAVEYTCVGEFDGREMKIGFDGDLLYVTAKAEGKVAKKVKDALGLTEDVTIEATYLAWGAFVTEGDMTTVTFAAEHLVAYTYGGDGLAAYKAALDGPCDGLSADKVKTYRDRLAGIPETETLRPYDAMTFRLSEVEGTMTVEGYEGRNGLLAREYRDGYLWQETVGKASGSRTVTGYFSDGSLRLTEKYRGETLTEKTVYNEEGSVMESYVTANDGSSISTTYWAPDKLKCVIHQDAEGYIFENQYDESGRYLVRKTTYLDGTVAMFEYRYDDKGRTVWVKSTYVDGSTLVGEYAFDDKGLPVKDTYTRSDGAVRTAERVFDDMGRVIHLTDRDYDGTLTVTEYVIADNEWQNIIAKVTVTAPDGSKTVTEYDKTGNVSSVTRYDSSGQTVAD